MYEYITNRAPVKGDIVEFNFPNYDGAYTHGKLYICGSNSSLDMVFTEVDDRLCTSNGVRIKRCKIVKTSPSSMAKEGDSVICIRGVDDTATLGRVFTDIPKQDNGKNCNFTHHNSWNAEDFLLLHRSNIQLQPNQNAEEQQMKQEFKLEVEDGAIRICKETKPTKPLTDLQKALKLPFTVVIFNADGNYMDTDYFKKKKQATAFSKEYLAKSVNLGSTTVTHEQTGNPFTTKIPVVEVK